MKPRSTLVVIVALVLVMVLSACATTDENRTRGEGAAAGALLGGVLGYLIDGERGALVGAALGAGAGLAVGNEIAKRKQAYASTEDFLDAEIARVDEFNRTASAYNAQLRQDLVRLDREAEQLQQRQQAGESLERSLTAKRNEVRSQLARSRDLQKALEEEYAVQVGILEQEKPVRPANDPYIERLEAEVRALARNIEVLGQQTTQMAQIDERLSV